MTPLDIAKHYFQLSNESNLEDISRMFCENSTFRSGKNVLFLGVQDIMAMQHIHHGMYKKLRWHVKDVKEIKPGIIHFEFDFEGVTHSEEQIAYSGMEDVIIYKGKIQHVQVQRL